MSNLKHKQVLPTKDEQSPTPLTLNERLNLFREQEKAVDNELGLGLQVNEDGTRTLLFADQERKNIVTIPTQIDEEAFNSICDRIIAIPESRYMLYELALAYSNRTPIMLEGGTALGKTFVITRFAELLYGEGAKIPDFYCNGQTDVSELMGKPVPAGLSEVELDQLNRYFKTDAGAALKAEMLEERGEIDTPELLERAALELKIPINKGNFRFQLGVLPKAMTGTMGENGVMVETTDGPGVLLHIQEVGLAAPSVVNALLKIRGEQGKLADSIQVHEDGGRLITKGPEFFAVFSTNSPGKGFKERFDIDKALSRALVWKTLPDELSPSSLRKISNTIFSFERVERDPSGSQALVDLSKTPELGSYLGEAAVAFHQLYTEKLKAGEAGRRQKIPATMDSLWKVAELLQNHQQLRSDYSGIDLKATLTSAIRGVYIDQLQSKPSIFEQSQLSSSAQSQNSTGAALLESLNEILSNGATNAAEFRGQATVLSEVISILEKEAFENELNNTRRNEGSLEQLVGTEVRAVIEEVAAENRVKTLLESFRDEGLLDEQDIQTVKSIIEEKSGDKQSPES